MNDVTAWMAARAGNVPDALRARLEAALEAQCASCPIDHSSERCTLHAAHLEDAATSLLQQVIEAGPDADPIDLLAADALITYACEAVSEMDVGQLGAMS